MKTSDALILVALSGLLSSCYVLDQAFKQNSMLNRREPIDEVIARPSTLPELRKTLLYVKDVIAFAKAQGLNTKRAYEYYVPLGQDAISYVVYAAEPLQLKSKTWWFPVVGEVPYLGFFEKADRDEEAEKLKAAGYDVATSHVGAFSSLGWFEDPIYEPMLARKSASLATLLFHELAHRSYWSIGSAKFNENLAEYVGVSLTKLFLPSYFGETIAEQEIKYAEDMSADRKLYDEWLKELKAALEKLYSQNIDDKAKLQAKARVYGEFLSTKFPAFQTKNYQSIKNKIWNNARVLSASLYSPELDRFAKAHRCLGAVNVGQFLVALKVAEDEMGDAFAALDSLCQRPAHVD